MKVFFSFLHCIQPFLNSISDDIWSDKVVEPELEFDESGIELAAIDGIKML